MGFLSESGVTALWNKVRAGFAHSLTADGAVITLKNGAATPAVLSQVTIPAATTTAAGVMSAADKSKLDGVASGATRVVVDASLSSTSANAVQNKAVKAAIDALDSDVESAAAAAGSAASAAAEAKTAADEAKAAAEAGADDKTWNGRALDITTGYRVPTALDVPCFPRTGKDRTAHLVEACSTIKSGTIAMRDDDGYLSTYTPSADYGGSHPNTCATTSYVANAIAAAQVGAAVYQGAASSNDAISGSDYKKGWYWVVSAAGTYVGETCEAGDMVFANSDKGDTYSASHFDVVQSNIVEMTAAEVEAICTL